MVAATRVSRRTAVSRTGARATQRRGRPPAGTSAAHREVVLDAVVKLLVERGYQGTTMAAVAERAGSSKETLYAWFASKQGLFTALIRRQAEAANQAVAAALDGDAAAPARSSRPTWPAWPPRATSASTTRPTPSSSCTGW